MLLHRSIRKCTPHLQLSPTTNPSLLNKTEQFWWYWRVTMAQSTYFTVHYIFWLKIVHYILEKLLYTGTVWRYLPSQQYQVFWLEIDNSVVFDNDETIEDLSCLVSDYNPSCSTELLDTDQWNEVSLAWLIISAIQMSEKRTFDKTQTFPGMDQATRIHSTSKQGCPTCTEFQLLLPQISGTAYGNPFPILELIFPHRQGLNVGVPEHFKS